MPRASTADPVLIRWQALGNFSTRHRSFGETDQGGQPGGGARSSGRTSTLRCGGSDAHIFSAAGPTSMSPSRRNGLVPYRRPRRADEARVVRSSCRPLWSCDLYRLRRAEATLLAQRSLCAEGHVRSRCRHARDGGGLAASGWLLTRGDLLLAGRMVIVPIRGAGVPCGSSDDGGGSELQVAGMRGDPHHRDAGRALVTRGHAVPGPVSGCPPSTTAPEGGV